MRIVHCLVLIVGWGLAGCHPRATHPQTAGGDDSLAIHSSKTIQEDTLSKTNGAGGTETCLGSKTVRGKLYHTKGRMGEVGGFILPPHFLTGGSGGNWKPEYEALVGKEVEVQGVHYRYRCGPIEQCLEGGVINYLRDIESLKEVE